VRQVAAPLPFPRPQRLSSGRASHGAWTGPPACKLAAELVFGVAEPSRAAAGRSRARLVMRSLPYFSGVRTSSSQTTSGTAVAAAAGVGVVSAAGAAAGLSAAGVMSGLATVGAAVGGGAVAGLAVMGAAPGAAGAAIMQLALADNENLPDEERTARSIGRKASIAGAAASSAVGIGAVSALGTAGLSAAGITSGLATVGGVVGGGMVAGSALLIAAPTLAAAGVGYGLYRAARWWRSS